MVDSLDFFLSHRVYLWMEGIWSEFGEIRVARGKRGVIRWFFGLDTIERKGRVFD